MQKLGVQAMKIIINDVSLRDGNHAIKHQLSEDNIRFYCELIDASGVDIVEVGHGNGIGASSLQLGLAGISEQLMLQTARKYLKKSKLAVHIIPGFADIQHDVAFAMDLGVDVFRVASHCTEADTTQKYLAYIGSCNKTAYGALMMSHMASVERLAIECQKMADSGAQGVIFMDSAGALLPMDIAHLFDYCTANLSIPLGFHAHNNLGMAVANSITAVQHGASMLDGSAKGFGAGAGNAAIELLVAILIKIGYPLNINLENLLTATESAQKSFIKSLPSTSAACIISGLYGVCSSFKSHVEQASRDYSIPQELLYKKLGERRVVAGQENIITQVAMEILAETKAKAAIL